MAVRSGRVSVGDSGARVRASARERERGGGSEHEGPDGMARAVSGHAAVKALFIVCSKQSKAFSWTVTPAW